VSRGHPARAIVALVLALGTGLLLPPIAGGDVYYMTDGDRISGKTRSESGGIYKVETPYGRVSIPKGRVARIVHDDGREELLSGGVVAPRPESKAGGPVRLVVVVTGATFWQAWNAKEGIPADPSLRLQLSIDEEPVVSYVDRKIDPDMPGATANSFSFPEAVIVTQGGASGVHADAPEVRPGRITLKLDLPMKSAGEHSFRVSYQTNDGTASSPAWRDLTGTAIHVDFKTDGPNVLEIHQDRGDMEYSGLFHKKMKNVETFRIEARSS
jgi:hypothetical protein